MTAIEARYRLPFPLTLETAKCAIPPGAVASTMTTTPLTR
jgi:hypothetical protein